MAYDNQNVFAKILSAQIPCQPLFKNNFAWAFADLHPQRKTHILLIPTGAYTDVVDFSQKATQAEQQGFWQALVAVQAQLGLSDAGFRIISNVGGNGGQQVPHFHVHILGGETVGPLVAPTA